jgi:hypothetical protein
MVNYFNTKRGFVNRNPRGKLGIIMNHNDAFIAVSRFAGIPGMLHFRSALPRHFSQLSIEPIRGYLFRSDDIFTAHDCLYFFLLRD